MVSPPTDMEGNQEMTNLTLTLSIGRRVIPKRFTGTDDQGYSTDGLASSAYYQIDLSKSEVQYATPEEALNHASEASWWNEPEFQSLLLDFLPGNEDIGVSNVAVELTSDTTATLRLWAMPGGEDGYVDSAIESYGNQPDDDREADIVIYLTFTDEAAPAGSHKICIATEDIMPLEMGEDDDYELFGDGGGHPTSGIQIPDNGLVGECFTPPHELPIGGGYTGTGSNDGMDFDEEHPNFGELP